MLSDCYPPRLGGIETQVRDLAHHLAAAGHQVEVFTATPGDGAAPHAAPAAGVRVHRVTIRLPFELPVNPRAPRVVAPLLAGFDVAHVHAGIVSPFAHDMVDLSLAQGIPTVVTWHSVWGPLARRAQGILGSPRRWARQGAVLTAVSAMAAERIAQVAESPIAVLPNGIDPDRWRLPAPPPVPDAPLRIATALRLAPRKRIRALIRMLRAIRARVPGARALEATIYGDGPLLGPARAAAGGQESWIRLPGRVTRESLAQAYAAADLYLSPTRMESFGIAALEARTAGLPVVALSGSGTADFISPGVEGLLARDDDALVDVAVRLLTDDALRGRIREHNRRTIPAQNWPAVVATTTEFYRQARIRLPERGERG